MLPASGPTIFRSSPVASPGGRASASSPAVRVKRRGTSMRIGFPISWESAAAAWCMPALHTSVSARRSASGSRDRVIWCSFAAAYLEEVGHVQQGDQFAVAQDGAAADARQLGERPAQRLDEELVLA